MTMIWRIAKKDFLQNILSARFLIGLVLCLFLIPFSIVINVDDYGDRVRLYNLDKAEGERRFKEVRVYSILRPEIVKPPETLAIFSRGISENLGSRVRIWLGEKPLLAEGEARTTDNPLLMAFFTIDFAGILTIIISLLALIFSYDICTREKEEGTLKLKLSNSLGRAHILLGKVVGVFVTLFPILILCYLLGILLIIFSPEISFSRQEWGCVVLLFSASLIYLSIFIFIGLFISTRARSSVTSIVVCLFFWVFFVFIVPNLSVYVAESFVRVRSRDNLNAVIADLDNEFREKCSAYSGTLEKPDWYMNWYSSGGRDGGEESYGCSKAYFEYKRLNNSYSEPLRIDYAEKKWAHQKEYLESLDRQRRTSVYLSLISPSALFHQIASSICHTDFDAHQRFMEAARQYREEFIEFFNSKKIFASYAYITPQSPGEFKTADELVEARTGGEFKSLSTLDEWAARQNDWMSSFKKLGKITIHGERPEDHDYLQVSDVPVFIWQSEQTFTGLKNSVVKIALLVIASVLLFYLSFLAFLKYDVR